MNGKPAERYTSITALQQSVRSEQLKADVLEGFTSAERGPCITAEESIARLRATIMRLPMWRCGKCNVYMSTNTPHCSKCGGHYDDVPSRMSAMSRALCRTGHRRAWRPNAKLTQS
jgi:hypothetical protein